MTKPSRRRSCYVVFTALGFLCFAGAVPAASGPQQPDGAGKADSAPGPEEPAAESDGVREADGKGAAAKPESGGAGPADPPAYYKGEDPQEIEGPSVVEGQKAGIEVGHYAPDFELQPIEPYACLQTWLGADDPESIEKCVTVSRLVGKAPILLLFGSYT